MAPRNANRIDTPAFAGATVIAGHAPTEANARRYLNCWYIHYTRDETVGVSAPRLTTSNRAASISSDCTIVASANEAAANSENILKRVSAVGARLKHAAVEPDVWIWRRFKIEVLSECQLNAAAFEESQGR
jgi:hypothetical protein